MSTLEDNGITDYTHAARKVYTLSTLSLIFLPFSKQANTPQFHTKDFDTFDYIFAMDKSNLSVLQGLQRHKPDSPAKVMLYGEYSGKGKAEVVTDPYYGGRDGFTKAYEQCARFGGEFLKEVAGK